MGKIQLRNGVGIQYFYEKWKEISENVENPSIDALRNASTISKENPNLIADDLNELNTRIEEEILGLLQGNSMANYIKEITDPNELVMIFEGFMRIYKLMNDEQPNYNFQDFILILQWRVLHNLGNNLDILEYNYLFRFGPIIEQIFQFILESYKLPNKTNTLYLAALVLFFLSASK